MDYISQDKLSIAGVLFRFVNDEILPGTGIEPKVFWSGLDKYVHELAKENKKLLIFVSAQAFNKFSAPVTLLE